MTATPTFTPQAMRDLTSSPEISPTTHGICHTQMCSEERCGTCSRKAAIRAALRHAATVVEENQRLKAQRDQLVGEIRAHAFTLQGVLSRSDEHEAALAALRAVIQQELDDYTRNPVGSLTAIAEAAGLWPQGEQVPLTDTAAAEARTTTRCDETPEKIGESIGLSENLIITRPACTCPTNGVSGGCARHGGRQAPHHKPLVSCEHTQVVPDYTPNDKLFAAADLERVMVEIPDMLRAEFDVVKKAIAMVEARKPEIHPSEEKWLGNLLAVLRGGE